MDSSYLFGDVRSERASAARRSGEGELVRELVAKGIDAYGIEPLAELVVMGTAGNSGLDLRADSEIAHLKVVAPASLAVSC